MTEEIYKPQEVVGMKTTDFINFLSEIYKEGHEKDMEALLLENGIDVFVMEKRAYDLMKTAVPTVQCSCKCFVCPGPVPD